MEILDLIQSGGNYTDIEYIEIKKLTSIRDQNIDLYEKFKKIYILNASVVDTIKEQLTNNNKVIEKLHRMYDENNKLYKHILTSLVETIRIMKT